MNFQEQYNALFTKNWRVKSYEKAFPLLIFAAKDGYSHAQNLVGYAFDLGLAPARDAKKAVHWYRKSAEGGSAEGLYNLALCYAKGRGIRKTRGKRLTSTSWLQRGPCTGKLQFGSDVR